jgi:hypothetical protein
MSAGIELEGQCHCGAIQFRIETNETIALECNCSVCQMAGFIHVIVKAKHFTLLAGRESLATYRFHTRVAEHSFCRNCGIKPFYRPRSHPEGYSINLRCLTPETRERFTIKQFDGQNWDENIQHIR